MAHFSLPLQRSSRPRLFPSPGRGANTPTGLRVGGIRQGAHELAYLPPCQQLPSCLCRLWSLALRLLFEVCLFKCRELRN